MEIKSILAFCKLKSSEHSKKKIIYFSISYPSYLHEDSHFGIKGTFL